MDAEQNIASQFFPAGSRKQPAPAVEAIGQGVINDTFLVSAKEEFILQRLNKSVFREPVRVMENLRTLLDHVAQKSREQDIPLQFPDILQSRDGLDYYIDDQKQFWRAISFIKDSKSYDVITGPAQAKLVGKALGQFHSLVQDIPPNRLYETLPEFHVTPRYVQAYRKALLALSKRKSNPMLDHCMEFANARLNSCSVLQDAIEDKILRLRVIHGDPKLNNFLFNRTGNKVLSLIDLDTLNPGLIHYDIADCLRSVCNLSGENSNDFDSVNFDLEICSALLPAWLAQARNFMTLQDYQFIYPAIRLLPLELGLRFLSDYLLGNKYFKVEHPEQNIERAIVQFKLVYDIEQKEDEIQEIISQCL